MKIKNDLTNLRFGRLVVVEPTERFAGHNRLWRCICDCGGEARTTSWKLNKGITQSCGCYNKERTIAASTTHGKCKTKECSIWYSIRQRCYNPKNREYKWYGARGIKMSDEWRDSFDAFLRDMGCRPSAKHSIDRVQVNGNYEASNCRWATKEMQANNTRTNVFYEHDGERLTQAQWARKIGITNKCLWAFLHKGKTIAEAVSNYAA